MKKIACIKKGKDFERKKDLKIIEELKEDKYEFLKENLKPLNKLLIELDFINNLKSNFKELNETVDDYMLDLKTDSDLQNKFFLLFHKYVSVYMY